MISYIFYRETGSGFYEFYVDTITGSEQLLGSGQGYANLLKAEQAFNDLISQIEEDLKDENGRVTLLSSRPVYGIGYRGLYYFLAYGIYQQDVYEFYDCWGRKLGDYYTLLDYEDIPLIVRDLCCGVQIQGVNEPLIPCKPRI